MAPLALNDTRRHMYLPAFVKRVDEAKDGHQRTVQVFIPGLRTRTGRTSRRQLQTFDVRHLAPLELANKKAKIMFRPEVTYYTENITDEGVPTFTKEVKVVDFTTRREKPASPPEIMWNHYSDDLDEDVFNDDLGCYNDKMDLPLKKMEFHPLQQPADDPMDMAQPPPPVQLVTRAGRRTKTPGHLKDFQL